MQLATSLALAFCTAPVVLGTVVPRGVKYLEGRTYGLDKEAGYGNLPDKDKPLFPPAGYSYVPYDDPATSSTNKETSTPVRSLTPQTSDPSSTFDKDSDERYYSQPPYGGGTSYGHNSGTPAPNGPSTSNSYDPSISYGNNYEQTHRGQSTYGTVSSRSRLTRVSHSSSSPSSPYDKDSEETYPDARSSTRSGSQTRGSPTTAVSHRASESGDPSSTYDEDFDKTYYSGRPTRSNALPSSQTAVTPTTRAGYRPNSKSYETSSSDSSDNDETSYHGRSTPGAASYGPRTGSSHATSSNYPALSYGPPYSYDKDSDKTSSRGRSTRSSASYGSHTGVTSTTTGPINPASSDDPSGPYDQTYRRQPSYGSALQSTDIHGSSYESSTSSNDKDHGKVTYRGRTTRSSASHGSQSGETSTTGSGYPSSTEDPSASYDHTSRRQSSYRSAPSPSKSTGVRSSDYDANSSYDRNSDKTSRGRPSYSTGSSQSRTTDTSPLVYDPSSSYDGNNGQTSRGWPSPSYNKDDDKTFGGRPSYNTVSSRSDFIRTSSLGYNPLPSNEEHDTTSSRSPSSNIASPPSKSTRVSSSVYDPSSPYDQVYDKTYTGQTPSNTASSGSKVSRTGYSAPRNHDSFTSRSRAYGTSLRSQSSSNPTGVGSSAYDPSTLYHKDFDASGGQSPYATASRLKSTRTGYPVTETNDSSFSPSRNYGSTSRGQSSPRSKTTQVTTSAYDPFESYGQEYGKTSSGESFHTASSRSKTTDPGPSGTSYGRPSLYYDKDSDETSRGRSSYVTASSTLPTTVLTTSGSLYDPTSPYGEDADKTYRRQLSYTTHSSVSRLTGSSSSGYDPSSTSDKDSDKSTYRRQSTYGNSRSYPAGNPVVPTGLGGTPSYQNPESSNPGATSQYNSRSGGNNYATDKDANPVARSTLRTIDSAYASRRYSGSTARSSATLPRLTLSAGSTPQPYGSSGTYASPTPYPVYDPSYVYESSSQAQNYTDSESSSPSPQPSSPYGMSDKDQPSDPESESLRYYHSGATALSHLPAPYPTSSMVPVFTPDTLGGAYGGGYWGVPLTYVSSDSLSTGPSASGIPIGYTATRGPYTPIPTIPGASSSLSKATESLYQSLCSYGDPACQPVVDPVPTEASSYYTTSSFAEASEPHTGTVSPSNSGPIYTTITGPGYTSVYSLAYGTAACEEHPTNSIVIYGSAVPSSSSEPGSTGYSVPDKDLPYGGYSKNSTKLAARTASPTHIESKGHRVVYASSLVIVGMLAVLLVL